MKAINIASIADPDLRLSAELLDRTVAGDRDGTITSSEIDRALEVAESDPRLADRPEVRRNLRKLQKYLSHYGSDAGARPTPPRQPTGNVFNALGIQLAALSNRDKTPTVLLKNGETLNSVETLFEVSYADRRLKDGQSVLVPLEDRTLFSIEVEYQDIRPLRDLELNRRTPGDYNWNTFRGDAWFDTLEEEAYGNLEIKRHGDTDAPFINNPIEVKIEILYPDGRVFDVGDKTVRFNVNDAFDADSAGYPDTSTIDNDRERLPVDRLPEGCMLRLTPRIVNKKPWEADRDIALDLAWVKPVYEP